MNTVSEKVLSRTLALATVTLAGLALAGCSLLPGGGGDPKTNDEEVGDDVFSMEVGDCLNDADTDGVVSTVPIVECSSPHDSEVYEAGDVPDGDFPDDEALTTAAEQICGPSFDAFIGLGYEESLYDYSYYFPTEESWAAGDREVLCVAFADDASKITGTLSGINS